MTRVEVSPKLLRWARERAGRDLESLSGRFGKLPLWESGEEQPTLKQLESFAKAVHVPVGFLFLEEPPVEKLPVPDFRTMRSRQIARPSPDLLETIYQCQQRQDWYREFARTAGEAPLDFVGSASVKDDVTATAARMRETLGFNLDQRRRMPNGAEALRRFIELADEAGVLVMVSGVVGSDNHRKLDPEEFRGFALADRYAPLVFVNGTDTKAAQGFTLAHELAHLWLGQTGLSNAEMTSGAGNRVERWCDAVAAEFLVPLAVLRSEHDSAADFAEELERLARLFRVSTLVILRRLFDLGVMDRDAFWAAFRAESARLASYVSAGGGNFYHTLGARTSKRFARAVVVSAWEGRSSFTEAFQLLGFKKMSTFRKLSAGLGVMV
jgi:Zn-dependent peptidase ImmA (M78 family)/transcriptional regulator with XRE-family HTH domain